MPCVCVQRWPYPAPAFGRVLPAGLISTLTDVPLSEPKKERKNIPLLQGVASWVAASISGINGAQLVEWHQGQQSPPEPMGALRISANWPRPLCAAQTIGSLSLFYMVSKVFLGLGTSGFGPRVQWSCQARSQLGLWGVSKHPTGTHVPLGPVPDLGTPYRVFPLGMGPTRDAPGEGPKGTAGLARAPGGYVCDGPMWWEMARSQQNFASQGQCRQGTGDR